MVWSAEFVAQNIVPSSILFSSPLYIIADDPVAPVATSAPTYTWIFNYDLPRLYRIQTEEL